jgi:hypothetical protein
LPVQQIKFPADGGVGTHLCLGNALLDGS